MTLCETVILRSGTYCKDYQGTNTKTYCFMEKLFFRSNSPCITYLFLFFHRKNKYSKVLNEDAHWTSTGTSCGTSMRPNNGTF